MHIDEFDYDLPPELIAQYPKEKREESRLLVVNKEEKKLEHKVFTDLLDYLEAGDLLVLNDSKVIPARLFGNKKKGTSKVEFLLVKPLEEGLWEAMVRPGKRARIGDEIIFSKTPLLTGKIVDYGKDGNRHVSFNYEGSFYEILDEIGHMPLPPYIKREDVEEDKIRYQTVYSRHEGSVAAPTAGLHFTEEFLKKIEAKGVGVCYLTLHVGLGTFKPVKTENIKDHVMHFEEYNISEEAAGQINQVKKNGKKIIAVGTTASRTLESAGREDGKVVSGSGNTGMFIYPGYKFKIVDSLLTNFHLPKSTLLMLVSAFYDKDKIMEAYREAIKEKYRFFSYGDAMLIR